jgi:hypothetical protein
MRMIPSSSLTGDDALRIRGLVYLKLKKLDLALTDYDAALQANPKNAFSLGGGRGAANGALIGGALGAVGGAATTPSSGYYGDGYSGYGSCGAGYNRYGSYGTRHYGSGYNGYGSYGPQYYGSDYNGSGYDGAGYYGYGR